MPTGKIKWYDARKGYGFIIPDDGTMEMFFHRNDLSDAGPRNLQDDQRVEYEIGEGRKGPCAVNVSRC